MFSIYTSAFLLNRNKFPFQESLLNFSKFADEVVIALNVPHFDFKDKKRIKFEDDGSEATLKAFIKDNSLTNVKIVITTFEFTDIEMDGKIKDAALQATKFDVKIQMDLDEIIPLSMKPKWVEYAKQMLANPLMNCLMIPTVDLYGARDKIKATQNIGLKFRMHKKGFRRGVWREAKFTDHIDTSKSDTCELIDYHGNLVQGWSIVSEMYLMPVLAGQLNDYIFTLHLGYVDLQHRLNINNAIWKEHWELRSGHKENVATNMEELKSATMNHRLILE